MYLAMNRMRCTTALVGFFYQDQPFCNRVMPRSSRISGGILRRGLTVCAVLGQILGTIGIIPVRAGPAEISSVPFPCQNHPCGCRTAAQCWSGACCCMTMREKVAWAEDNGIVPPQHAVQMAAAEPLNAEGLECDDSSPGMTCCSKAGENSGCCSTRHNSKMTKNHEMAQCMELPNAGDNKPTGTQRHAGWISGVFAKKCHGLEFNDLGILNIGFPPALSTVWLIESALVDMCQLVDQSPFKQSMIPLVPPPRC
jgi:hypothetical protein